MKNITKTTTTIDFACAGVFAATSALNFFNGDIWFGIATVGMCIVCLASGIQSRILACAK